MFTGLYNEQNKVSFEGEHVKNKLKLEDITILNEGQQIKKRIIEKYGSLTAFYDTEKPTELSLKAIRNYCSYDKITSINLKCLMLKVFNEGWDEIIISDVCQVKNIAGKIYKDIRLYKEDKDYALLQKVKALCSKFGLIDETALMLRCLAKHFYFRNSIMKTLKYYNEALRLIDNISIDTLIIILVELADHHYMEREVKEAERLFIEAQNYIDASKKISSSALYKYYYRRGIMLNSEGLHSEARGYIEKSIMYAGENTELNSDKGASYMAIGSTYKREGVYEEAKKYYSMSLLEFHEKDINGRSLALNNLADVYCILKDYDEAIKYIEAAVKLLDKDSLTERHLIVAQTLAEIKLLVGDASACYEYFNILKKTIHTSIDKKNMKNRIISITNYIEDVNLLNKLYDVIFYIEENTDNYAYKDDLFSCMGRILIKISKKEV